MTPAPRKLASSLHNPEADAAAQGVLDDARGVGAVLAQHRHVPPAQAPADQALAVHLGPRVPPRQNGSELAYGVDYTLGRAIVRHSKTCDAQCSESSRETNAVKHKL